jgi:hypothetical protein
MQGANRKRSGSCRYIKKEIRLTQKSKRLLSKLSKMKCLQAISILWVLVIIGTSCEKQKTDHLAKGWVVHRTVSFLLYTDKDFSHDQGNISFNLFIENSSNGTLWDSALAPMKLRDIPGAANKILAQKSIPDSVQSLLKAGFRYSIEGVGSSWYFDSVNAGQASKIVEFDFK